ncbi:hypothetical protein BH23ACT10_BH23ACT10_37330 [soil metagenome]
MSASGSDSGGPDLRSTLDAARQVADAVLYEGYVLFPYRASALKNKYRWQWGVVIPQAQVDLGASEPSQMSCEILVRAEPGAVVDVTARFLHLRLRQVEDAQGRAVDELEVDGDPIPTWEEGLEHEVTVHVTLPERDNQDAQAPPNSHPTQRFELDASEETEQLGDVGRAVRTTWQVTGELRVDIEAVGDDVYKLRPAVHNTTPWSQHRAPRDDVLRRSIVGVHVLAHAEDGVFASVIDPPDWATDELHHRGLHPVLIGDADQVVLGAPIILYDHPQIAPESPGPSFDATEVDELLALAVMGLSDDEKRRARATDPRAAALIDRTDTLPAAIQERLHGAVRQWGPGSMRPEPAAGVTDEVRDMLGVGEEPLQSVAIGGHDVEVGDRVRLRPTRRADAHDLFIEGRVALVERIVRTVEGETYLAITVDDDPAAELHRWYGRFQYFGVDEVEPLPEGGAASTITQRPASEATAGRATHEGG